MSESALRSTVQNGVVVIDFDDNTNLDGPTIEEMQSDLFRLVEEDAPRGGVIDLKNVAFISSQALGVLVTLRLKAARGNTRLVLAGVREPLLEIVTLTQIDKLYELFPSSAAALASFESA